MKVVVVYESHWGNTAAVAKAIAEGMDRRRRCSRRARRSPAAIADADLIIAGAPVMAFSLPSDRMLATLCRRQEGAVSAGPVPPVDAVLAG